MTHQERKDLAAEAIEFGKKVRELAAELLIEADRLIALTQEKGETKDA